MLLLCACPGKLLACNALHCVMPGAETEVAESTAPTETPQPAQESSEQSAQPMRLVF